MKYAIIENNIVTNIAESESALMSNWVVADDTAHIGMAYDGTFKPKPFLPSDIAAFISRIDSDVDAIYAAVVGNRSDEYVQAFNEATSYKAAGYTGAVPKSVQSWADAKSWTATQAADDILLAAARLATLRDTLRAQRLSKKELAKVTTSQTALDLVVSQWNQALAAIKTSAGL